jgi:hypothetical protein
MLAEGERLRVTKLVAPGRAEIRARKVETAGGSTPA